MILWRRSRSDPSPIFLGTAACGRPSASCGEAVGSIMIDWNDSDDETRVLEFAEKVIEIA
ncbi:hypothetical protein C2E31_20430 [Rhodopirellula baltica]|nr:hypothetical protein C2E31_20430 [Rhodopirellula baltica]